MLRMGFVLIRSFYLPFWVDKLNERLGVEPQRTRSEPQPTSNEPRRTRSEPRHIIKIHHSCSNEPQRTRSELQRIIKIHHSCSKLLRQIGYPTPTDLK